MAKVVPFDRDRRSPEGDYRPPDRACADCGGRGYVETEPGRRAAAPSIEICSCTKGTLD